mgnify:FL=1
MSTEAISFYLTNHLNTGCFAFYYDFDHYDGDYILTTGSGDYSTHHEFSGAVNGNFEAFTGSASGSGAFSNNYIKVENIENETGQIINRNLPPGFTFLVSQEKVDNSCGTIFSNYAGLKTPSSGWEFGVNNANRLYFKFQSAFGTGDPANNILTLDDIPAAKNIYGIVLDNTDIYIGRYLPESKSWNLASRGINPAYIRNNNDWYIGSGEYNYSGYMDKFAYFNQSIPFYELGKIAEASFQEIATGLNYQTGTISGAVTGREYYPSGKTGVIGQTGVVSGIISGSGSGLYITGSGLTGTVDDGQLYYQEYGTFTGSGASGDPKVTTFYTGIIATSTTETLYVTGFQTGTSGVTGLFSGIRYSGSGITGVLETGSGYTAMFEPNITYVINSGSDYLSGELDNSYLYNTISFIGERSNSQNTGFLNTDALSWCGDMVEISVNLENNKINLLSPYGYSYTQRGKSYSVGLQAQDTSGDVMLFQNGILQTTGYLEYGPADPTNINNPNELTRSVESGNYILSGLTFFTTSPMYDLGDLMLYDSGQNGIQERLDIFNTSEYLNAPFSEITPDQQIFFNGQKIYSGIDYGDNGGFMPTGEITGITGTYLSRPAYSGVNVTTHTGLNLYDLTGIVNNKGGVGISGDPFVGYINGVRGAPADDFIKYCTGVCLLTTGRNVVELPQTNLYNITTVNTFF